MTEHDTPEKNRVLTRNADLEVLVPRLVRRGTLSVGCLSHCQWQFWPAPVRPEAVDRCRRQIAAAWLGPAGAQQCSNERVDYRGLVRPPKQEWKGHDMAGGRINGVGFSCRAEMGAAERASTR